MSYDYKMIQISPSVISAGRDQEQAAADYLQRVVNEHAVDGWEFYRVDDFDVLTQGCCLGAILGAKPNVTKYYVVTFRKPK